MSKIVEKIETTTYVDPEGNEQKTIKKQTNKIVENREPDYIKLYTHMWCNFNDIPKKWEQLFLQIVTRMSYCDATDLAHSQTLTIYGPVTDEICEKCGWSNKSTVRRGLKELCELGAIRRVGMATYQVNPQYAGRGEWRYNPRLKRGGVEELVMTFAIDQGGQKTSNLDVVWADDGTDSEINDTYRKGLGVKKKNAAKLIKVDVKKKVDVKQNDDLPGQTEIDDFADIPAFKKAK